MTHIDKVGDRFQQKDGDVVEIVEVASEYTLWKVLHATGHTWLSLGDIHDSPRDEGWDDMGWTYLGNFNKSNNFQSLYEKLNEKG